MIRFMLFTSSLTLTAATVSTVQAAPVFNVNYDPGVSAQAQAAFQKAATAWSSYLSNNVTINLNMGFASSLEPNVVASTGSVEETYSYSAVRAALTSHSTSAADATAVAHLPTGDSVNLLINRTSNSPIAPGSATPYVDNDGDTNNTRIDMTSANAKALGLKSATDGATDAGISFNSGLVFDYDPDNGITSGAYDFVGSAIHEIAHALGFFSGVDYLDNTPGALDSDYAFVSPLDLFRYSASSYALGVIDWTADTRAKYFSLDGGTTQGPEFSTGVNSGDGYQPGHWKDNLTLGLFDPTTGIGEQLALRQNDLTAVDVIGWNLAPTPVPLPETGILSLFSLGGVLLAGRRRSRQAP